MNITQIQNVTVIPMTKIKCDYELQVFRKYFVFNKKRVRFLHLNTVINII